MMSSEYKPHDFYSTPVDPGRCKASVPNGGRSIRNHQCSRKPWEDGWCKQHHPDTVKERQEQQALKDEERWERSPSAQLGRALERIKELQACIDEALGYLSGRNIGNIDKLQAILEGEDDE